MPTVVEPVLVDVHKDDGTVEERSYTSLHALVALGPQREPGVVTVRIYPGGATRGS